ncbi:hydroxyglutarate oxidase [Mesorhizobium sp. LSJC255A00]|uniref:L-2-hydroxyglutarate oxidase n=1 Tax=unclassified Mesorhizobium TaxID=325217 RepID=UPI0003CF43D3|nr:MULTISPECIES: L-2-hydroxyglutarate oxidase [unclassified Mesorhizobium]ESX20160.1 hydroxyglutarate oxidase [Mesorhizobium sp. LSJC255A00]ESX78112.1 hydroxyglutarate oxidase [Mesorhizobium sp. LSHC414A00]
MSTYDVVIIGGGIVGVATAMRISDRYPGFSVAIIEKEADLAQHQTGRNSGVIHAGVYYKPGSLKALFCKEGVEATIAFCRQHSIPFDQCGKMIVATKPDDLPRMTALYGRSKENGLNVEVLDAKELARREPRITGLGALFVPTTGIVDYAVVARKMGAEVVRHGGEILTGLKVEAIKEDPNGVTIEAGPRTIKARHLIVCAGIMADRLAKLSGLTLDFQLVPFRGEYYRLGSHKNDIVSHLIYPVPDPALPFLGVHLTRMVGGYVTVGPNAVLAFAREGYRFSDFSFKDVAEIFSYRGFRVFAKNNLGLGLSEMANSLSKRRYLALCRQYCPELKIDDLEPYRPGIRAQAVMSDGTIEHDFIIRSTARIVHVCNAPSPAATSSMPIARAVVDRAATQFSW